MAQRGDFARGRPAPKREVRRANVTRRGAGVTSRERHRWSASLGLNHYPGPRSEGMMRIGSSWLGVLIAMSLAGLAQAAVVVEQGRLAGTRERGLTVYKGVPYAAVPVGALRWREPAAAPRWRGVRAADAFAPACMQAGVSMPGEPVSPVSEDCLYLNVWAPAGARGLRPVMVFFPGGGFTNGSTSIPLYRGDRLARRGVVVVTVGYRLGPLGFLALPELTHESPHASSGNYGLLDQVAALRWVQRNIGALGGDRRRVTIFGQSAGAMSVSILMASPLGSGLFQRPSERAEACSSPCSSRPNTCSRPPNRTACPTPPPWMPARSWTCVGSRLPPSSAPRASASRTR